MTLLHKKKCCCQTCYPEGLQVTIAGVDAAACTSCFNFHEFSGLAVDGVYTAAYQGQTPDQCVYRVVWNSVLSAPSTWTLVDTFRACGGSIFGVNPVFHELYMRTNKTGGVNSIQIYTIAAGWYVFRNLDLTDSLAVIGNIGDTFDNLLTEPAFGTLDGGTGCYINLAGNRQHLSSGGTITVERLP